MRLPDWIRDALGLGDHATVDVPPEMAQTMRTAHAWRDRALGLEQALNDERARHAHTLRNLSKVLEDLATATKTLKEVAIEAGIDHTRESTEVIRQLGEVNQSLHRQLGQALERVAWLEELVQTYESTSNASKTLCLPPALDSIRVQVLGLLRGGSDGR